ncbi:MAG: aldehyde ferredoxin oxidoreductase family protein [Desulfobacterales bacterium]
MNGYLGKVLNVNLTTGSIETEAVPEAVYKNVLSGVGLGAYYLYKHIPADADPLGPDNMLGIVSGLLTNTGSLMTGRWMAVCKSPLTGGWGDANCGGTLAPAIKQCGVDAVFFTGISPHPVYLYMDKETAQLRDAAHVWGKDAVESEKILQNECKTKGTPKVAVIGQAGENQSLISGIVNDGGRISARSGVGAVMGSKNLKAVVLDGSGKTGIHDKDGMKAYSRRFAGKVKNANLPKFLKGSIFPIMGKLQAMQKSTAPSDGMMAAMANKRFGTIAVNTMGLPNGDSPVKNWSGSVKDFPFKKYRTLNPDRILARETRKYYCSSCVIGCGGMCRIEDIRNGRYAHTHKPEYETCSSFGCGLLNNDLDAVFYINEMLNRAGMDTISAGNTAAFAIECFENGLITEKDTDGLTLKWGDADALIALLEKMVRREGIGDILADGVKSAVSKLGPEFEKFAVHVGGQEPGMHDPKMDPLLGVHFSADPTPGRHTIGAGIYYNMMHLWQEVSWAPEVKKHPKSRDYVPSDEEALKSVAMSAYKELNDGAGGCFFAQIMGLDHWNLFEMLNFATGWNVSADDYMEIGKRIQTLRQMFNVKHGVLPKDFIMKGRVKGDPPLTGGALKGITLPIEDMVKRHWKQFGWNEETGVPEEHLIRELNIDELTTSNTK